MHDFLFLYESINAKAKTLEQISSWEQRKLTILFCVSLAKCGYFCKERFLKSHVNQKKSKLLLSAWPYAVFYWADLKNTLQNYLLNYICTR